MSEDSDEALIEASSLGSEGARQLRDRSRAQEVSLPQHWETDDHDLPIAVWPASEDS